MKRISTIISRERLLHHALGSGGAPFAEISVHLFNGHICISKAIKAKFVMGLNITLIYD